MSFFTAAAPPHEKETDELAWASGRDASCHPHALYSGKTKSDKKMVHQ